MKSFLQRLVSWFRTVLSESDGTGSSTRVLMFVLVLAAVVWSSVLLFDVHTHHVSVEQFNAYLTSIGQYLTITCSPLYATNKISDCYNNRIAGRSGNNDN